MYLKRDDYAWVSDKSPGIFNTVKTTYSLRFITGDFWLFLSLRNYGFMNFLFFLPILFMHVNVNVSLSLSRVKLSSFQLLVKYCGLLIVINHFFAVKSSLSTIYSELLLKHCQDIKHSKSDFV